MSAGKCLEMLRMPERFRQMLFLENWRQLNGEMLSGRLWEFKVCNIKKLFGVFEVLLIFKCLNK